MSNMSYCRFENTACDLNDCWEHWDEEVEGRELKAKQRLIRLVAQIAEHLDLMEND